MNEFSNTNYSRGQKADPVGVYRLWKNRSVKSRDKLIKGHSVTSNFYYVRVYKDGSAHPTTIGKAKTREEAETIFRKYHPDWQGEIPYYENIDKRYKKP